MRRDSLATSVTDSCACRSKARAAMQQRLGNVASPPVGGEQRVDRVVEQAVAPAQMACGGQRRENVAGRMLRQGRMQGQPGAAEEQSRGEAGRYRVHPLTCSAKIVAARDQLMTCQQNTPDFATRC